jgi:hypothetical protein
MSGRWLTLFVCGLSTFEAISSELSCTGDAGACRDSFGDDETTLLALSHRKAGFFVVVESDMGLKCLTAASQTDVRFRLCDPEYSTKWQFNGALVKVAGTDLCLTRAPMADGRPSGDLTAQQCADWTHGNWVPQQWNFNKGQLQAVDYNRQCLNSMSDMASCEDGTTHSIQAVPKVSCTKPSGSRYYKCVIG